MTQHWKGSSSSECSGWTKNASGLKRMEDSGEGWTMRCSHIQKTNGQTLASSTTDGLQLSTQSSKPITFAYRGGNSVQVERKARVKKKTFLQSFLLHKTKEKQLWNQCVLIQTSRRYHFHTCTQTGHRGKLWILEGEKCTSYISEVTWYINEHFKD